MLETRRERYEANEDFSFDDGPEDFDAETPPRYVAAVMAKGKHGGTYSTGYGAETLPELETKLAEALKSYKEEAYYILDLDTGDEYEAEEFYQVRIQPKGKETPCSRT